MNNRALFILFISTLIVSLSIGYINTSYIKIVNPDNLKINSLSLVNNSTIWSIDNSWYLDQVENLFSGNGYILDEENESTRVRRTPGYSLWFALNRLVFGQNKVFTFIPYTQSILYALSIVALVLSIYNFTSSRTLSILVAFLGLINPFVVAHTFFTITEAIHPAFVVFTIYFFSIFVRRQKMIWLMYSGIFGAVATLIRPTNGLIIVAIALALLFDLLLNNSSSWLKAFCKQYIVFLFGFSLLLTPWVIRNYIVTNGEIVFLERFYNDSPMEFGKSQYGMTRWMMGWSNESSTVICNGMITAIHQGDTVIYSAINGMVNNLPEKIKELHGIEKLKTAYIGLQNCLQQKEKDGYLRFLKPNEELPLCDKDVFEMFENFRVEYIGQYPFDYYIFTPLIRRGKEFILHSFSTMYSPLLTSHSHPSLWKQIFKSIFYLFNLALYLSLLFSPILFKHYRFTILFSAFTCSTFLVYVYMSTVEGRYMLSTYPLMTVILAVIVYEFGKKSKLINKLVASI